MARRLRVVGSCLDSSVSILVTGWWPVLFIVCSLWLMLVSSVVLKPNCANCCSAWVMAGLGLVSVMCCIPAFWKNGFMRAMTAMVSTCGVPACGRVSWTSFVARPMLRYFGWITMRVIVLISCCSCCMVPFQVLLRPKHVGGGCA